jgi:glycosyltransferase involved in cell wall biosynthesis
MTNNSAKRPSRNSLFRKDKKPLMLENPHDSKKKLLIIAHNHPDFFPGGGEIFAYRMFEELKNSTFYQPIFLAATGSISRTNHAGTPFLNHKGQVDEYLFWSDSFDYFKQSQRQPTFLFRDFAQFLSEHQPDIVHLHHTLRIGVEALSVIKRTLPNARIIYTLHDFIPICHNNGQMVRTGSLALCEKASPDACNKCFPEIAPTLFKARELFLKAHFDLVDIFVSPSVFLAERYVRWGIDSNKICVIENGIPELPIPLKTNSVQKRETYNHFGFFGQISPYKGTMLILEAAKILLNQGIEDFQISIYGNVELQTPEFQSEFAASLKECASNVQFLGKYCSTKIGDYMNEVDWVVMPSIWWENSPLVIAEAKYYRKPILCSNIGGMAEKVQHEVEGLHFEVGNSNSLANAMIRAIKEKGLWQKLQAKINPPTTINECLQSYIYCYENINNNIN